MPARAVGMGLGRGGPAGLLLSAGGAAAAYGRAGQALVLGPAEQFGGTESLEFVLDHGVSPVSSVSGFAFCDASTFVSEGGVPHRESSASWAGLRALDAHKGP